MRLRWVIWLGFAILLAGAAGYFVFANGTSSNDRATTASSSAAKGIPVAVAPVEKTAVDVTVGAVGNAEAYASVAIKSRVDGQLIAVHFKDGQAVKKGDLLYSIDPRSFQAALDEANAVLDRDRAQLANAQAELKRTEKLKRKGFAAQQQLDLDKATATALEETIKSDQAAIANAQLRLGYTEIRAPLDGRAGDTQVDAGNLIKANDVPLVVINRIKPIYVAFSVPERYALEIRQRMAKEKLQVEVSVPNVRVGPQKGVVTFIDNAVDSDTGTILVKATLPNEEEVLLPGQFVTVSLRLSTIPDALVVPSQAIQTGQKGDYVFVVKADGTADLRPVVTGETAGQAIVVRSGLDAGETVVTEGQLRLRAGVRVAPSGAAKAGEKGASK
jgi:multidrug efflux system membrane fusion protein